MTEEEESERQGVVDNLVGAVRERDALITCFYRESDPSAIFLPGKTVHFGIVETSKLIPGFA